jgi:CBS domain-containing protein
MVPLERLHALSQVHRLSDVLPLLADPDVDQLPIVQDRQLVGMLSQELLCASSQCSCAVTI